MTNRSITLTHPGAISGRWLTKDRPLGATIVSDMSRLRLFDFHPERDVEGLPLAPVFLASLNGSRVNYRDQIHAASSFDQLFSIAANFVDTAFVDRLRFLKAEDANLTEDQDPLSFESCKLALLFLLNYDAMIRPELTVTAAGHIQIEWYEAEARRLVIECLDDGTVRYVVLYDGEQGTDLGPAGHAIPKLASYQPVWRWFHGRR